MSRQSVAKAHQKIQELAWEPLYHEPVSQYGTDYTFQKAAKKDPLKQVLRSYFPMQEEKDHRVYGAQDGAIRGNMFRQVQERWLEWQKLFLSIIPLPEISAARAMPLLFRTVPNPELHNGQAIQMIDEVRHSTIQQNLKRLYMNNYIDPAGFNSSLRNFQNDYCGTIGRQFAEGFITGDAITAASIYLTIVAETAFTNTLFVAMPAEAAANGDYLLPTVFHSVQSDESRHISNGYATLLMALADESNHQLLERDLRYAWWNNHRVVDAAIGTFIEYGTKDRRKDRESYAEMWRRWIYDDYAGAPARRSGRRHDTGGARCARRAGRRRCRPGVRGRPAGLRAVLLQRRHLCGPGGHAGLPGAAHPVVPAPRADHAAGPDRARCRAAAHGQPGDFAGSSVVRDPVRTGATGPADPPRRHHGPAGEPAPDQRGGRRRDHGDRAAERVPALPHRGVVAVNRPDLGGCGTGSPHPAE